MDGEMFIAIRTLSSNFIDLNLIELNFIELTCFGELKATLLTDITIQRFTCFISSDFKTAIVQQLHLKDFS